MIQNRRNLHAMLVALLFVAAFVWAIAIAPVGAQQPLPDRIQDGDAVTLTGTVEQILSANAFVLVQQVDPAANVGDARVVIFNDGNQQPFDVDINVGRVVSIAGTIWNYDLAALDGMTPYAIDMQAFATLPPTDYAIVATDVTLATSRPELDTPPTTMPQTGVQATPLPQTGEQHTPDLQPQSAADWRTIDWANYGWDATVREQMLIDPTTFYGNALTMGGVVETILGPNSFTLMQTQPVDFSPARMVIIAGDAGGFAADINVGAQVMVTGDFFPFSVGDADYLTEYSIDPNYYVDYGIEDYMIVATATDVIEPDAQTLPPMTDTDNPADPVLPSETGTTADRDAGNLPVDDDIFGDLANEFDSEAILQQIEAIEDTPDEYIGTQVTIGGNVEDILDNGVFTVQEIDALNLTPLEFAIFPMTSNMSVNAGDRVVVRGVLYRIDDPELSNIVGYEINTALLNDYTSGYAIVAEAMQRR